MVHILFCIHSGTRSLHTRMSNCTSVMLSCKLRDGFNDYRMTTWLCADHDYAAARADIAQTAKQITSAGMLT